MAPENNLRFAPLWALSLLIIIPLWAPKESDIGQAYGFYATWQGRLLLAALISLTALAIYLFSHPVKGQRLEILAGRYSGKIILFYFLAYATVFSTLAIIAYLRFHSDVDYANFLQLYYSASHGKFFTSCLSNAPHEISIFADHNSPILMAILPVFLFLPYPPVFIVISSLLLGATALILFRYLRRIVRLDNPTSLCLSFAATLAPYFVSQNFQGLSMEMFGPPLFILAFYLFERDRFWPFMLSLLALNLIKEQVAIVMLVFVPFALLRRKNLRWAIGPLALNLAMLVISFGIVIPHFRPTGAYKILNPDTARSLPEQALGYLRDPMGAIRQVTEPFRLTYIYILAATNLFFLPFLALESLFVLPSLAKNLLFVGWAANIMSKHTLLLSGAMSVAVGKAVRRMSAAKESGDEVEERRDRGPKPAYSRTLAILLLASSIAHFPVWWKNINLAKDANHEARLEVLERIPPETPIAAPQNMLARFAARNKVYNSATPEGLTGFDMPVDYVILDISFHPEHYDYEALLRASNAGDGLLKGFKPTWQDGGLYLFERVAK
ncbi:MAG: DUF2079 domain-containing protein [Candidatus Coatesbacteria bacterium]|nr:DUF2079 domain-containing protein [Candidatus Coatesbacteria bacterium]